MSASLGLLLQVEMPVEPLAGLPCWQLCKGNEGGSCFPWGLKLPRILGASAELVVRLSLLGLQ